MKLNGLSLSRPIMADKEGLIGLMADHVCQGSSYE